MKNLQRVIVGLWAIAIGYVGAALMARHEVSFSDAKKIAGGSRVVGQEILSSADRSPETARKPYIVIHILDESCSCSRTVIDEIADTEISDASAAVLTLSVPTDETRRRLERRGIKVKALAPKDAREQFGLETVPWLVVLDRELNVLYSGGYSETKVRDRADLRIVQILAQIRQNRRPAGLPTFGCVTSDELRRLLLQF